MRFVNKLPDVELQVTEVGQIDLVASEKVNVLTLCLAFLIVPIMYLLWLVFWDNAAIWGIFQSESWWFIGSMLVIFLMHECVHLLAHPRCGMSDRSIAGASLKKLFFFVSYTDALSRNRLVFIALLPLLVLSFLPLVMSHFLPQFVSEFAWCSLFNAGSSGADIYLAATILKQVPSKYFVHGKYYGDLALQ